LPRSRRGCRTQPGVSMGISNEKGFALKLKGRKTGGRCGSNVVRISVCLAPLQGASSDLEIPALKRRTS
jgi:hypothetical protein